MWPLGKGAKRSSGPKSKRVRLTQKAGLTLSSQAEVWLPVHYYLSSFLFSPCSVVNHSPGDKALSPSRQVHPLAVPGASDFSLRLGKPHLL